jgi:glycosyltransferase 2 family protein
MMKHLLKVLGILLALAAGIYFVLYAQKALAGKDLSALLDSKVMLAGTCLTLLYASSIFTTAIAWTLLLRSMLQPARFGRLLPILATTQFGKYLPGNVAQHIGRIALARSAGVQLPAAVFSVAYELLLALVASAHIGALTLLWSPPTALLTWRITEYRLPLLVAVTVFAVAALWLAPSFAVWLGRLRAGQRSELESAPARLHLDPTTVVACYALYASGFAMIGAGLWLVAHALTGPTAYVPSVLFFVGAFASSWILGFIAPGAPAGLGIREAMLSAWLSGVLAPVDVVLLVVTLRIATTLGDLLNFAWGSVLMLRRPED